ncbi:hypothetical protein [Nonomuraea sp. NPDC050310]|uniref:NucA/NucB deoxyribonuclease domain-containing protein n=1 Tax=Nonomuraea sp. NPDC050310 TaxID=3154935 RepID=UPI0033FA9FAA
MKPEKLPKPAAVKEPANSCRKMKEHLSEFRAKGAKTITCLDAPAEATAAEVAAPPGGLPEGLPSWCVQAANGGWQYTRFNACTWRSWTLKWVNVDTGAQIGSVELIVWDDVLTAWSEGAFVYGHRVYAYNPQGAWNPRTYMVSTPTCLARCVVGRPAPDKGVIQLNTIVVYDTYLQENLPVPSRGVVSLDAELVAVDPDSNDQNLTIDNPHPVIRCDDGMLKGHATLAGCVMRDYKPTLVFRYSEMPDIVDHVKMSQAIGSPGEPGTSPLQRMYDDTDAADNREMACEDVTPGPSQNCDEYPFAHSYQGAVTCGCDDWTARAVNATDNTRQGTVMSMFFQAYRVLDGDAFWVDTSSS